MQGKIPAAAPAGFTSSLLGSPMSSSIVELTELELLSHELRLKPWLDVN